MEGYAACKRCQRQQDGRRCSLSKAKARLKLCAACFRRGRNQARARSQFFHQLNCVQPECVAQLALMSSTKITEFSGIREEDLRKITVPIKDILQAESQDAARFVIREMGGFIPS